MTSANTNYPTISDSDLTALSKLGPIEDCAVRVYRRMCQTKQSVGYYNILKAMLEAYRNKFTALVYWIIGARRIGKTDFFLMLAIELWNVYGKQTMWIRSMDVELSDPSFSADFLNDAKLFKWCPEGWLCDRSGVSDGDGNQIIKFQALSTFSNRRGASHPDVEMIFFDEFCPESKRYPKMALTAVMSLTKTVFAGRRTSRMFCGSNFVSIANPYFAGLEIYPSEAINVYPEKMMVLERCEGYRCSIDDGNPWNKVYEASGYGNYASEEEDKMIDLVCKLPKRSKPLHYALMVNGKIYLPYDTKKAIHWTKSPNVPYGTQLFASNIGDVTDKIPIVASWVIKNIKTCVENDAIRFDEPNTLFAIMSLIYDV